MKKKTWRFWINGKGHHIFKTWLVYSAYYERICGKRGLMFSLEKKLAYCKQNPMVRMNYFGRDFMTEIKKAETKAALLRSEFGDII